jgi:parvulin-like peptidyl-prolyl isomerase
MLLNQKKDFTMFYKHILHTLTITGFLILLTIVCLTCDKFSKETSPVIAKVGKAVLTIDDLNKSIPHDYSDKITRKQRINYVKQWIDSELLYQAALRNKIHKEKKVQERLERMKKDLLGAEVINRNSLKNSGDKISEEAIINYYEQHKDSFIREYDVIKYLEIIVQDLKTGWHVRNAVTPNNFLELAAQYSIVPVKEAGNVQFVPTNSLPPEISDLLIRIRINGTTSPIRMSDGVHIFRIIDKKKAGEICLLEEVKEEIVSILATEAQKKHIENLHAELTQKTDHEFHFELIAENNLEINNTDNNSTIMVHDK